MVIPARCEGGDLDDKESEEMTTTLNRFEIPGGEAKRIAEARDPLAAIVAAQEGGAS
jgi:hypothetical protein